MSPKKRLRGMGADFVCIALFALNWPIVRKSVTEEGSVYDKIKVY